MNNPQPKNSLNYTPPLKPSRKFWYVFFGVCGILIILSITFRLIVPEKVVQRDNTWLGITPGISKEADLYRLLGKPINRYEETYGQQLDYASVYPTVPNKVLTNKDGDVIMVQLMADFDPPQFLKSYTQKFGEPDLKMYSEDLGDVAPGNIFLSKGVMVFAHVGNDQVEQVWYFQPTTLAEFKEKWKDFLSDEAKPEPFLTDPTEP